MRILTASTILCCSLLLLLPGCSGKKAGGVDVIEHYNADSMDGVITRTGVSVDKDISSDGQGSLHIVATEPETVKLYETGDIDVEAARLIYQAKVRTENFKGEVYLEMWCHFPGKGEFFSRALQSPLSGTTEWTSVETPFFLQTDQNPDNVRLNLVCNGTGDAWIDDLTLSKAPAQ